MPPPRWMLIFLRSMLSCEPVPPTLSHFCDAYRFVCGLRAEPTDIRRKTIGGRHSETTYRNFAPLLWLRVPVHMSPEQQRNRFFNVGWPSTNFKCVSVKSCIFRSFRCLASRASPGDSWSTQVVGGSRGCMGGVVGTCFSRPQARPWVGWLSLKV